MLLRVACCDATTQVGLGHLIVEVSRNHVIRLTHPLALSWTSGQFVPEASTYTIKKKTSIPKRGIEHTIPEIERRQIHCVVDCTDTGTGDVGRN